MLVDIWKITKVPLNPPTCLRNFISNKIERALTEAKMLETKLREKIRKEV